jgi:cytochrome c oxidase cbb3-type subunit 3
MRRNPGLRLVACLVLGSVATLAAAQQPGGRGRGGGQGAAPPPGRQGGNPNATFPAQQRALAEPAVIARGDGLYDIHCQACHGADLRGGEGGGTNLLRSPVALADQAGELLGPLITQGRQTPGLPAMPPIALPQEDLRALAAYIHSVQATMRGQGSPPAGPPVALNILVGDAAAGQAFFKANCAACHSPTGDLQGLASRLSDPVNLQNTWVAGGRGRGANTSPRRQVTVAVTPPGGATVEGRLDRIDDFMVILTTASGEQRSFSRRGDVPKVEVRDPMEAHRRLLGVYTDRDIHNVTAYLVTLK